MGKIGLAIRGAGAYRTLYVIWTSNAGTVWLKIDGLVQFGRDKKTTKKRRRKLIAKSGNVDVTCFTQKGRKGEGNTMACIFL